MLELQEGLRRGADPEVHEALWAVDVEIIDSSLPDDPLLVAMLIKRHSHVSRIEYINFIDTFVRHLIPLLSLRPDTSYEYTIMVSIIMMRDLPCSPAAALPEIVR